MSPKSKKVLILAYDFPPYVSVGGLRPYNWFKYLKEFDVEPVVITRQWNNKHGNGLDYISKSESGSTIIEESEYGVVYRTAYTPNLANRLLLKYGPDKFRLFRKSISFYYEVLQFFFNIGPKRNIYVEANKYLQNNKVDLIIATGEPFILFNYASKLSRAHKTMWIADYRDPWSANISHSRLYKYYLKHLESRTVKSATIVLTVSEYVKHILIDSIQNKISILENGYNPEYIDAVKMINQQSNKFSIALMGSTYKWHPVESFLSVLSEFTKKNPNVCLNLYGVNNSEEIILLIESQYLNLSSIIRVHSKLPNNLLLKELASNNVMLLFNYYAFMGTKIYDYIAIKRKILFCYSNDSKAFALKEKYYASNAPSGLSNTLQEDLIRKKNAGIIVENENQLYGELEKLYAEFKQNGFIKCETKDADEFSRRNQTKKLAEIIKSIT